MARANSRRSQDIDLISCDLFPLLFRSILDPCYRDLHKAILLDILDPSFSQKHLELVANDVQRHRQSMPK